MIFSKKKFRRYSLKIDFLWDSTLREDSQLALPSNIILEREMFDTITSNTAELITAVKSMLQAAFKMWKN